MGTQGVRQSLYAQYGLLIPDRYAALTVASLAAFLEPSNAVHALRLFNTPGQYLLIGPTGTGKTSMAAVAARQWGKDSGKVVAFVTFGQFCSKLSSLEYGVAETLVVKIQNAPILVLDDLGNADATWNGQLAAATPRKIDLASDLVAARHAAKLPTIVTTNLNNAGLQTQLGARVASRLSEFEQMFVGGTDLRFRGGL